MNKFLNRFVKSRLVLNMNRELFMKEVEEILYFRDGSGLRVVYRDGFLSYGVSYVGI